MKRAGPKIARHFLPAPPGSIAGLCFIAASLLLSAPAVAGRSAVSGDARCVGPWKQAGNSQPLHGVEAIAQLKKEGSYVSLGEAVAAARYSVDPVRDTHTDGFEAFNPGQGIRTTFSSSGVRVRSSGPRAWEVGFKLLGYGYDKAITPLVAVGQRAEGNRVEFDRSMAANDAPVALTEWYVNKPNGLEQGFTIFAPPLRWRG